MATILKIHLQHGLTRTTFRIEMRRFWKGLISFGPVNIPVGFYSVVDPDSKIHSHLRRASDYSPIKYSFTAETTGEEVSPDHIVKSIAFEEQEILLTKEEYKSIENNESQGVSIKEFVDFSEIEPVFCDKVYYVSPDRAGEKAFILLRKALKNTGKVAIGTVIIRRRERLAALKPYGNILLLEVMHYAQELADPADLEPRNGSFSRKELMMSEALIRTLSDRWQPKKYKDPRRAALMKLLKAKSANGLPAKRKATKPMDICAQLQASLSEIGKTKTKPGSKTAAHKMPAHSTN